MRYILTVDFEDDIDIDSFLRFVAYHSKRLKCTTKDVFIRLAHEWDKQLDSVVSSNGNYEVPTRYFERDYAGELVVVKPFLLPETRLTPEHPVLFCGSAPQKSKWYEPQTRPSLKKEWKPAGELTKDDWVFFPLFKGEREADPELLYLLGLYMAEGYPTGHQVCFSLGHHERELAEQICQMVEKHWNVRATINRHRSGFSVRFSKEALADFMRKQFGSRAFNKKIPSC